MKLDATVLGAYKPHHCDMVVPPLLGTITCHQSYCERSWGVTKLIFKWCTSTALSVITADRIQWNWTPYASLKLKRPSLLSGILFKIVDICFEPNVFLGYLTMFLLSSCNRPSTRCLAPQWKCPMTRLRLRSEQTKSFARWIWTPTTGCHWRSLLTAQWTTRQLFSCCSVSRAVQRRTASQRCGSCWILCIFTLVACCSFFLDFRPASLHCFNRQIYAENYFVFLDDISARMFGFQNQLNRVQ